MRRRPLALALIIPALVIAGCAQEGAAPQAQAVPEEPVAEATPELTLAQLATDTAEYVDREVAVQATVDHVCKHGGKRMFLVDDSPEHRFKVTAGDPVGSFDVALEGSDVRIVGVVREQRVDEAYLDAWEADAGTQQPEVAHEGHQHTQGVEADGGEDHDAAAAGQIEAMRRQLAESGQDHLSFYSLEGRSVEEIG